MGSKKRTGNRWKWCICVFLFSWCKWLQWCTSNLLEDHYDDRASRTKAAMEPIQLGVGSKWATSTQEVPKNGQAPASMMKYNPIPLINSPRKSWCPRGFTFFLRECGHWIGHGLLQNAKLVIKQYQTWFASKSHIYYSVCQNLWIDQSYWVFYTHIFTSYFDVNKSHL